MSSRLWYSHEQVEVDEEEVVGAVEVEVDEEEVAGAVEVHRPHLFHVKYATLGIKWQ